MSHKETTRESYQATAQSFSQNVASLAPIASIDQMMKLMCLHPKVIDIGCGSGRDAKHFCDRGAVVTGIDFCSNLLDIAKLHAPLAQFMLMDIESLDFPANAFDGAWAACSLVHIAKNKFTNVLKKIHQILKPNGYFYLALKKGATESLLKDDRYEGDIKKFWSLYEEDELKRALNTANFNILEFELIEKSNSYQTHAAFKVFCQKGMESVL